MRPPALLPLLLAPLLLAQLLAAASRDNDTSPLRDDTPGDTSSPRSFNITTLADEVNRTVSDNVTALSDGADGTVIEPGDGEHEPVVRKKRTFGDIVFRGLADVLGYSVQRKPTQAPFPPPLAPVPGIDAPLQAGPAPAAPAPPPCGAPRAAPAAPPPCRAQAPPPPPPPPPPSRPPPCPRPRAAPRPRPKPRTTTPPPPPPPPPPPSSPPCARPRANPATPAPCAPAPAAPPPPPKDADSNLETITSNFQLNFNLNRRPAASATPAPPAQERADFFEQELEQNEVQNEVQPEAPIAIQPRAARLPPPQPREPRVYVDAFLERGGVTQRVPVVDAAGFDPQRAVLDDYLDDEEPQQVADDDDYEDVQESRDRAKAVREFGTAVDRFWENKKRQPKRVQLPADDYRRVHFGDRDLSEEVIRRSDRDSHQNLQRARIRPNAVTLEPEEEHESTTTTEDPRRPLKPRILPPTEQNPAQIDTVTVRVPPIYREKRPKKLHRERPDRPDRDEEEGSRDSGEHRHRGYEGSEEEERRGDSDGEHAPQYREESPARRRRRKPRRRVQRSADDAADRFYTAGDYDYFGNKLPISKEEEAFRDLTVPPPTIDEDLARLEEAPASGHFLEEHERLRDEPPPLESGRRDPERADESERSGEAERGDESERAGEGERTDRLGPNARVRESGYENRYVHATKVHVDEEKFAPTPAATTSTTAAAPARPRPRAA